MAAAICDAKARAKVSISPFLADRLKLSAIPHDTATYAGIRSMTKADALSAGYELHDTTSDGFVIPYYDMDGKLEKGLWRWRNNPDAYSGFIPQMKYDQPSGTGCFLYLPRVKDLPWKKLVGAKKKEQEPELVIVEGELKALSLCLHGVLAVAVGGVWNFANNKLLLPELRQLASGRNCRVLFDSDAKDKPQVLGARAQLMRELAAVGATVTYIEMPHLPDPQSPDKTGADDFIRLNPNLKDEALRTALCSHAGNLPEVFQLCRLNAEYVIDESKGDIMRLAKRDNRWNHNTFCKVIQNKPVEVLNSKGEPKMVPVGQLWLGSESRNRVVGHTYKPVPQHVSEFTYIYENGNRLLNDFMGWASVPKSNPKIVADYWTRLIDTLFMKKSAETEEQEKARLRARKWFEQWWAYAVRYPGTKMRSAVVLSGKQGGGKDMVGRAVGKAVYGKHYRSITQEELQNNFNDTYMKAVSLIHAQELTNKNNKKNLNEILKAWITNDEVFIDGKYKDQFYENARFNFFMTTNPEDSIHLDGDDRRYFVWRIADARIEHLISRTWVEDFHRVLVDSPEGRAALHYHLLHEVDLNGFNRNAEPPMTEWKVSAKHFSTNEAIAYIDEFEAKQRAANPDGVWLYEEERLKAGHPDKMFLAPWRDKFQLVGRVKVPHPDPREKKRVERGLWILKPSIEDIKKGKFPTMAEVKARYLKRLKEPPEEA